MRFQIITSNIKKIVTLCLAVLLLCAYESYSQGCSDAGFCTIGNLAQRRIDSVRTGQKVTLLLPLGRGDENVFIFSPGIQYDNQFSERWSVQAKVTANYANGNLGSASGPGDFFLSGTRIFHPRHNWKTSITLGAKLPLSLGNLKEDGRSLPMQYQSSLGTVDLIVGLSLSNASWQFSAGWQQPLSGINRNNFLPVYWGTSEASLYPPTNDFNRRGDLLVRAAYLVSLKEKFHVTVGLLGIYHLAEDTYIDANESLKPIALDGSQGLTLNATLAGFLKLNKAVTVGFTAGSPLVYRDLRPDGLTRSFVFAPEIRWTF